MGTQAPFHVQGVVMSYSRKVSRGIAFQRSNLLGEPQNAVKQVVAQRKRRQIRLWEGQLIVDGLLKCCGHGVRALKVLDQHHEGIYVRGTSITPPGRMPRCGLIEAQMDSLRQRIRKVIREHEASAAAVSS